MYISQKFVGLSIVSESNSMCLVDELIDAWDAVNETRGRVCHA